MKIQTFLIAFLTIVLISASAQAGIAQVDFGGDGIQCSGKTYTYNADGSITVKWDWDDEGVTYDSMDDYYMDVYGFIPPKTFADGGFDQMFNITSANNSSQNQNGLSRQRGRLIYSVKEANEVAKEGSVNKVRLRYR
ncbi:MAG: hypothetical protein IKS23_01430 [Alphaproteobacteria bacterium]|nr:hypothetical protein [Alphaproteobacteria bacterium]